MGKPIKAQRAATANKGLGKGRGGKDKRGKDKGGEDKDHVKRRPANASAMKAQRVATANKDKCGKKDKGVGKDKGKDATCQELQKSAEEKARQKDADAKEDAGAKQTQHLITWDEYYELQQGVEFLREQYQQRRTDYFEKSAELASQVRYALSVAAGVSRTPSRSTSDEFVPSRVPSNDTFERC